MAEALSLGSRVSLTDLTSERGRRLNGTTGVIEAYNEESGRYVVRLDGVASPIKLQLQNLCPLREHRATVEPVMAAELDQLLSSTHAEAAATGGMCAFGEDLPSLPADVVLLHVFPLLSRVTLHTRAEIPTCVMRTRVCAGELAAVSEVCHEWHGMSLALRALTPACAVDVKVKLQMEDAEREEASADGEYRIWPQGDRSLPPVTLYCHNVLGARPTEFITLAEGSPNLSYFPSGGAARGSSVVTSFTRLRVCPWLLMVKTDDYTFATSGGALRQVYWNGQRRLDVTEVPYATARDAAGHAPPRAIRPSPNRGQAQIDLRGTGFAVSSTADFSPKGCGSFGVIGLPTGCGADLTNTAQPRIALYGGGYAGRFTPVADKTLDEKAANGNYDHEGRNGGWVLQLVRAGHHSGGMGAVLGALLDPNPQVFECPVAALAQAGAASGAGMATEAMLCATKMP